VISAYYRALSIFNRFDIFQTRHFDDFKRGPCESPT